MWESPGQSLGGDDALVVEMGLGAERTPTLTGLQAVIAGGPQNVPCRLSYFVLPFLSVPALQLLPTLEVSGMAQ